MQQHYDKYVICSLKNMKIDLLFLIIAHMLSLHMYQTFILAYSHYMIHWYMNISIVEEDTAWRVLIAWLGTEAITILG